MKANAPENMYIPKKIYLPYKDGKVIGLVKDTGVPYKSGVDGNIEYIRKDYLLEWTREEADKAFNSFAREELGTEARERGLVLEQLIKDIQAL